MFMRFMRLNELLSKLFLIIYHCFRISNNSLIIQTINTIGEKNASFKGGRVLINATYFQIAL